LHPYAECVSNSGEVELGGAKWPTEKFNELVRNAKCGGGAGDDGNYTNQDAAAKFAEVIDQRCCARHARGFIQR
jgi:hypothetical protein